MTRINLWKMTLVGTPLPLRRLCAAAVLAPVMMLGAEARAIEPTGSPFMNSGSSIIRVAAELQEPTPAGAPVLTPPPPDAEVDPTPAVDSGKKNPRRLRPISEINPSYDYDPDGGDACKHLCPRDSAYCPAVDGGECPDEEDVLVVTPADRMFPDINYMWCASNLYHNPLYFEDVQLERYGQVKCNEFTQSFVSMGKFGGQLIGLPYQMALDNPHDRRYALGYYRPGDCAPRKHYRIPLNARAAAASIPAYTGAVFLLQ